MESIKVKAFVSKEIEFIQNRFKLKGFVISLRNSIT